MVPPPVPQPVASVSAATGARPASERLTRSAGVVGAATLTSRILGLVRDQVQGALFATGPANDAFTLATRIPLLLRDLFAEGAMSAAFVPTFTRQMTNAGPGAAWRLGSLVVNGLVVVTGAVAIAGAVFARPLTTAFASQFAGQAPGKLELAISLTRLNMPFLVLIAVAAALMGMLNAVHRFFVPAVSPATFNVVFILSALVLTPVMTHLGLPPIMSLTVGTLVGGAAQVAVQWPSLRRAGYRHEWALNFRDPGLREVLVLMGPGIVGIAAAQINAFVNMFLATGEPGAVSALAYAFRVMYLPVGVFGVSIATAAIPSLARHAALDQTTDLRDTLSWALRMMLTWSIPATAGLMLLAPSVVEVLYERGNFHAGDARLVSGALFFYAPGIVGFSIVKVASSSFYALRDARTPVFASLVTVLTNTTLNLWLNEVMGFRGLALGAAIAANVNAGLLLVLLARRIGGLDGPRVLRTLGKVSAATVVMGLATYLVNARLGVWLPAPHLWPRALRLAGSIGAGLAALTVTAWLIGLEELHEATGRWRPRPGR